MIPLAPPLKAVLEIRFHIESGVSTARSVKLYTQSCPSDEFAQDLSLWLFRRETGQKFEKPMSVCRKNLIDILDRGLKGEPVIERLKEFEAEVMEICKEDLEKHLERLPYICLMPLMLFQFPAFLLLLAGPLILNLLEALQN